jgi:flagellar hook assembly protein FlgD
MKDNRIEKISLSNIKKIQFGDATSVKEGNKSVNGIKIQGNYPNPFSNHTKIEFEIEQSGEVEILIFNTNGQIIQTLKCENCLAGKNSLYWNCMDKEDKIVPNGIYYYEVRFNNESLTKIMFLVK